MARTRESVKAELIQHPEYARINGLTDTPSAIEYNVSLFYAYKMAFGEGATVEEWQTYTYRDRAKREHYDSLVDLINIHARNEIRVESVPR